MSKLDFETAVKQEEARLRLEHPTVAEIPSCMTHFDDFLSCNIIGKQLKSLYRFGRTSECAGKWDEFKHCMSHNRMHPEERREVWIRRRAEWWAQRRLEKSSEDVWDVRTEPLANFPPAGPQDVHAARTLG